MKIERAAVLLAVMALLLGLTPAAQADVTWVMKSRFNNYCLDYNPTDGVHTRQCNGGDFQRWDPTYYSDGTTRYMNVATKMCLDASEFGVRGWGCNDLNYQRWTRSSFNATEFQLLHQRSNHCLDMSEFGVRTIGCNGGMWQRWVRVN
ncbi:RICIN domain-containing protein [Lentzea sp. NPDC092896]|uniref:RICIN domain-containing protein n=1 Tax=Lentzea sp. NPDC092896 TaxID=3364127 RepID=UPI00382A21AA